MERDGPGEPDEILPAEAPLEQVAPRLVSLEGITFRYPTGAGEALREVSLDLRSGELVAIVGESGSGKTTLVDLLIGLLSPQYGTVRRPGAAGIGYVSQDTFVWDDTVRFNVALDRTSASANADAEVWASLESARLATWVRTLPEGLDTRLGERGNRGCGGSGHGGLGGRWLFRLGSSTSCCRPARTLARDRAGDAIKDGVGIVVVTHDPIVVEYSDRTVALDPAEGRATG